MIKVLWNLWNSLKLCNILRKTCLPLMSTKIYQCQHQAFSKPVLDVWIALLGPLVGLHLWVNHQRPSPRVVQNDGVVNGQGIVWQVIDDPLPDLHFVTNTLPQQSCLSNRKRTHWSTEADLLLSWRAFTICTNWRFCWVECLMMLHVSYCTAFAMLRVMAILQRHSNYIYVECLQPKK